VDLISWSLANIFWRAGSSQTSGYVCYSCRQTQTRRHFASAAAATADADPAPPQSQLTPEEPLASPSAQPQYTIKAGVVLSRPPILTPDLHPFETAYYLYQRRLNERLVLPFTQYFYYKRGTPAYEHWRSKRRERAGAAARDVGAYNAYSNEGWNDEVLTGNKDGKSEEIVKKLIDEEGRAAEFTTEGGDLSLAGLKRTTLADEQNDQKSLERNLSRTLYLLVKTKTFEGQKGSHWAFPAMPVVGKEGLKEV
jgi:large subunit ribosomal protein L46